MLSTSSHGFLLGMKHIFTKTLELTHLSFMVGGVALVMPLGKLYALYDAKWIFNIGFVIFIAASALCGGAPTIEAEIVGRVFAGAGGNAMYLGLLHLISVNTTDQERPAYLSLTYEASDNFGRHAADIIQGHGMGFRHRLGPGHWR